MSGPWRRDFDEARDPYTARNALGITSTGGGGGAPTNAEYVTSSPDATLTNERVLTNSATITWDFSTPGQAKANTAAGGGNVSNSGTPTSGQYAKWVTATTIQGVAPATVLSDIGAQPAGNYQPLDADLTAIAALAGTNVIYYRSAADTWSPITIGTGLSFTGGTLANTVSTSGLAPLASPVFTGDPQAPTPATADNDTSIATTAFVKAQGYLTSASAASSYQPLDATLTSLAAFNTNGLLTQTAADTFTGRTLTGPAAGITVSNGNGVSGNPTLALANDLAALEALSTVSAIPYRSGTDAWAMVTIGTGLTFSGGTLSTAGVIRTINIVNFSASGTYTCPANLVLAIIECVGGGGGGGGGPAGGSGTAVAGGGGGGGYSLRLAAAATIGASQTVTIGAGGGGSAAGAGTGSTGGDTSFGSLCIGKGGGGGGTDAAITAGGAGGGTSTGTFSHQGSPGHAGINGAGGLTCSCGGGGSSHWGGGAPPVNITGAQVTTGNAGGPWGGGGGGGVSHVSASGSAGGNGYQGYCVITEFLS